MKISGDLYLQYNGKKIRDLTDEDLLLMAVALNTEVCTRCSFTEEERNQFGNWITTFAYITFENFRENNHPEFLGGELLLARKMLQKMVPAHPEIASAYEEALVNAVEFGQNELHR